MTELVLLDQFAKYWLCGLLGGLFYDLLRYKGVLKMPRYDRKTGQLRLGTVANMVIGVGAAVLADGKPQMAFSAAIAGPVMLESAANLIAQRLGEK